MNFSKDNLHHAYICIGEHASVREYIKRSLKEKLGIETIGNPDVLVMDYDMFGIDDARFLIEKQQNKALNGGRKFFIITLSGITLEAQNSLLKVFEEPTDGTHFFVISMSEKIFIATLLSRTRVELFGASGISEEVVVSFLSAGPGARIAFVKDMIESKDRVGAMELLTGIVEYLYRHSDISGALKAMGAVAGMRKYILDRSASIKMIMEYVSLGIPRFMV